MNAHHATIAAHFNDLVDECHGASVAAGWWGANTVGGIKPDDVREVQPEARAAAGGKAY